MRLKSASYQNNLISAWNQKLSRAIFLISGWNLNLCSAMFSKSSCPVQRFHIGYTIEEIATITSNRHSKNNPAHTCSKQCTFRSDRKQVKYFNIQTQVYTSPLYDISVISAWYWLISAWNQAPPKSHSKDFRKGDVGHLNLLERDQIFMSFSAWNRKSLIAMCYQFEASLTSKPNEANLGSKFESYNMWCQVDTRLSRSHLADKGKRT